MIEPGSLGAKETKATRQPATFWPEFIFIEAVVALAVTLGLLIGASLLSIPHERIADPIDSSYIPRPEWYFLFLFELLKYFPGELEWVGVAVIPTIVVLILLLLPFIDRSPARRPTARPIASSLAIIGLLGIVFLTYRALAATPPTVTSHTLLVAQGEKLFQEAGCLGCHSRGPIIGGNFGGDLANVGNRRTLSWVHRFIENPGRIDPDSKMPAFLGQLSHEQVEAISLYLMEQRIGPATASAPVPVATAPAKPETSAGVKSPAAELSIGETSFKQNCNMCHPGGGVGVGPPLKQGAYKGTQAEFTKIIRQGKGAMPLFPPTRIDDGELQTLYQYISALQ
ncbi:MAG: c-type cytochrome [Chloroflexi bacterium]|nr:c-type cytochrome [Chloroflexota bacterium]